jgi:hypothetical protein
MYLYTATANGTLVRQFFVFKQKEAVRSNSQGASM